jgi:hypothetical protein
MRYKNYRSKFEHEFASYLSNLGVPFNYELYQLEYWYTKKGVTLGCMTCGSNDIQQKGWYKPDFWLPEQGIFVETKGRFTHKDRNKMVEIKKAHPETEVKLLFMDNRVFDKRSGFRHLDWCEKNNYDGKVWNPKEGVPEWLPK